MKKMLLVAVPTLVLSTLLSSQLVLADLLELNNGKTFEGTLVSKEGDNIVFDADGMSITVKTADVKNLSLGSSNTPATEQAAQAKTDKVPAAASDARPMAPVGTRIAIKLGQPLDSRKVTEGHRFEAVLQSAIVVDGVTLAPSGSVVYGVVKQSESSGRIAGESSISLTLTDIKVNDQMKPIQTSGIAAVTENTAKNSAGRTLRGAALGGLVDGKSGARTGAKVGAGAAILSGGNQVVIPAGTLFDFTLAQAAQL
ncbi:MAG: hypothetical protein V7707_21120 [Motiliproteus sp.]